MKIFDVLRPWLAPVDGMRPMVFYGRSAWIVVQLVAAYWFSKQVSPFFYQQF